MASPRKSVRKRVNISYAKLLDEESDDEFFQDKLEIKPPKKNKKSKSDDEDFALDSSPTLIPKKQKAKKTADKSSKSLKGTKASTDRASKTIESNPDSLSIGLINSSLNGKQNSPVVEKKKLVSIGTNRESSSISLQLPYSPPLSNLSAKPIISECGLKQNSPVIIKTKSILSEANKDALTINTQASNSFSSSKLSSNVCVTPSSSLRIGLSRKNITKHLHPNVRLSN